MIVHPLAALHNAFTAVRPRLLSLIAADDNAVSIEWFGNGLTHHMLGQMDRVWCGVSGSHFYEGEEYMSASPLSDQLGADMQSALDGLGLPMTWHFPDESSLHHAEIEGVPVLSPIVNFFRDGNIKIQYDRCGLVPKGLLGWFGPTERMRLELSKDYEALMASRSDWAPYWQHPLVG
jgi:hypothetical protein